MDDSEIRTLAYNSTNNNIAQMQPALAYNHLYDKQGDWNPYQGKNTCLSYALPTNFKTYLPCDVDVWTANNKTFFISENITMNRMKTADWRKNPYGKQSWNMQHLSKMRLKTAETAPQC